VKEKVRISVSGVRGRVPDAVNVEVVSRFASSFASYLEIGKVALCRDGRPSGHMLEMAAAAAVVAAGCDCICFGTVPTPLLQFLMTRESFSGGMSVSAGHNPLPWNALIFLNEQGRYLEASEGAEVFNIHEAGDFQKAHWQDLGHVVEAVFPMDRYLEELGKIVDVSRIRKARFKVVADPCNGGASGCLDAFGAFFGLDLIVINDHPGRPFPHPPEPNEENAAQVEAVVKATAADLGSLLNSDGSRISYVTGEGRALSEELTVPLSLLALKGRLQKVVTTTSTSYLVDWACKRIGAELLRSKVGQSSVVHMMEGEGAEAGGEGSGSFAFAPFSHGYDALLSLALLLDHMARTGGGLNEIVTAFPTFWRKKLKIDVPPWETYRLMDNLEETYLSESADFTDGIRIERDDVWFNIRPSTTEFTLRIIVEGRSEAAVEEAEIEIRERVRK